MITSTVQHTTVCLHRMSRPTFFSLTRRTSNACFASAATAPSAGALSAKITLARSPLQQTRTQEQQNELEAYFRRISSSALGDFPAIDDLLQATTRLSSSYMASPADTLAIVQNVVRLSNARRCIEIGVYTGIMTLAIAVALPQDGSLVAMEKDEEIATFGLPYWKQAEVADKIDLRVGAAVETLRNLLDAHGKHHFDLAFIDADKANYQTYYELCLQLIRPGGVILIDNTLWGGRVTLAEIEDANTQAIRQLNSNLLKDDRVYVSVLANADGLSIVVKKK